MRLVMTSLPRLLPLRWRQRSRLGVTPPWPRADPGTAGLAVPVRRATGQLAAIAVATAAAVLPVPLGAAAASGPPVPPLNTRALKQAIAGPPDATETAALARVTGWAGSWSGTAGVADLADGTPALADHEFRIGSMTKMFIATVVLQLAAEHRITLALPAQDYLPGLLRAADPPVTVAELLNHTSGLGPADGEVDTGDPQWFLAHRLGTYSTRQLLGPVLQQPLVFRPGTRQQYNGVNYIVLGMLIQKVTGHSYAQEIQQRILGPLGMRHTYVPVADTAMHVPYLHAYYPRGSGANAALTDISEQNPSLYGAQGNMISTTADLSRFMTALLRGRLLPPAQLGDMFTIPTVASGPSRYSMGLLAYTLPNRVTVWGMTGETAGYASEMFATRDLARMVVFAYTPVGQPTASQVLDAYLGVAQAAFDPPADAGTS
jgi:D-alanyl-D-alanine carboxypeptidase